MKKKKIVSKKKHIKRTTKGKAGGNEDARQRRKYARGGRIEAYTFGEALSNKDWP